MDDIRSLDITHHKQQTDDAIQAPPKLAIDAGIDSDAGGSVQKANHHRIENANKTGGSINNLILGFI